MNKRTQPLIAIAILALANLFCGFSNGGEQSPVIVELEDTSTDTSTPPLPTATSTDIPTPVPPTPTETPIPPTATEPINLISVQFEDEPGDAVDCNTQNLITDPEVDMQSISVFYNPDTGAMLAEVKLEAPLVNNYSFAVLLYVLNSEGDANSFLWEIHDDVYRLGQMDVQTGTIISDTHIVSNSLTTTDGLSITHNEDDGVVSFNIPSNRLLDENVFVAARSFHTGTEGEAIRCDQAGSFQLPEEIWAAP